MSDWPDRFRELDLQEMQFDIQTITCYLPDPWYRMPVCYGITAMMFGGFGLMGLAALCTTTFGPVWTFFTCGVASIVLSMIILWKYDDWTDDPCSIILDKKMYRETEAAGALFSSHSKVNDHVLDRAVQQLELERIIREEEEARGAEMAAEIERWESLTPEERRRELQEEIIDHIKRTAIAGNMLIYGKEPF